VDVVTDELVLVVSAHVSSQSCVVGAGIVTVGFELAGDAFSVFAGEAVDDDTFFGIEFYQ